MCSGSEYLHTRNSVLEQSHHLSNYFTNVVDINRTESLNFSLEISEWICRTRDSDLSFDGGNGEIPLRVSYAPEDPRRLEPVVDCVTVHPFSRPEGRTDRVCVYTTSEDLGRLHWVGQVSTSPPCRGAGHRSSERKW